MKENCRLSQRRRSQKLLSRRSHRHCGQTRLFSTQKSRPKEDEEDMAVKLRRIIDRMPVRVSYAGCGSSDFHQVLVRFSTKCFENGELHVLDGEGMAILPTLTREHGQSME
ncbi:hypothetical protein HHK36_008350 [Tetracentron sinense]|uniref:Uncharacterized protein n=1 Tax=Tetracentron sinense TaxID=13715 RepID=A0A834ZFD2_TETSI|nr:hypothetical protein HHK36_008350 [Tetracentron sinense]